MAVESGAGGAGDGSRSGGGGSNTGTGGGGGGGHNGGGGGNHGHKAENLARQYGFVQSFFDTDPELKKLFHTAVNKTWTPERFIAELRDTKWFKHNSVTVRNAIMQKTADPATYKSRVQQLGATIRDQWGSMFGTGMDPKHMHQWAETAYTMGWSEAQVIDHMTKGVNYTKMLKNKRLGGTAAENATKIEALGRAYGLNPSNKYIASQIEKIVEGNDTFEGTAARLKDWAKREYKAFGAELDGGQTIQDIAEPYKQKMAELLEMNPETINVRDGMIQNALKSTDKHGNPAALSFTDFEDMLRQDKRWQYTDNAKQHVAQVTSNLLKSFGLLA